MLLNYIIGLCIELKRKGRQVLYLYVVIDIFGAFFFLVLYLYVIFRVMTDLEYLISTQSRLV